jgi:Replication initiator protein, pSAM2
MDRLAGALRFEPCSPWCANWLRYGIQPKNARPGLVPGRCKGKAHRPEHVGYAGRRVLTSRKWSGKTLKDHRGDRKAWLVQTLGLEPPDPARYTWQVVTPSDRDYLPPDKRLLHVVAERGRWKAALAEARRKAQEPDGSLSATGILRGHIEAFGVAPDGRLFSSERGQVVASTALSDVWAEARTHALTPEQVASPLAGRPYDLRHAAVSPWLNAGVPAPCAGSCSPGWVVSGPGVGSDQRPVIPQISRDYRQTRASGGIQLHKRG